jgi:hypothetical protein
MLLQRCGADCDAVDAMPTDRRVVLLGNQKKDQDACMAKNANQLNLDLQQHASRR